MTSLKDDAGQRDDDDPPAGPPNRMKSVTFTAALAALDAMLGVLANKFFDAVLWAAVVIVVGVVVVVLTVIEDRADNGHQLDEAWIKRILTSRTFIALAAATVAVAVAVALALAVTEPFGKDNPADTSAKYDYYRPTAVPSSSSSRWIAKKADSGFNSFSRLSCSACLLARLRGR